MKINREQLIKLINEEIERLQRISEDDHTRRVNDVKRDAAEYVARTSGAWELFAQRIGRAIAAGNPVTCDLIPVELRDRGARAYIRVFETRVVSPPVKSSRIGELATLRNVLEASSDAEVSTYALEKQGFPLGRFLKG